MLHVCVCVCESSHSHGIIAFMLLKFKTLLYNRGGELGGGGGQGVLMSPKFEGGGLSPSLFH